MPRPPRKRPPMSGTRTTASARPKQTTLRRLATTAVNDLGMDATVAIIDRPDGPLVSQVVKGFSEREARAVLRTLSKSEGAPDGHLGRTDGADGNGVVRLRMVAPGFRNLLAVPLKEGNVVYGALVAGKQGERLFTKRETATIESAGRAITTQLRNAGLFDRSIILAPPWVAQEPVAPHRAAPPAPAMPAQAAMTAPAPPATAYASPQVQERIVASLTDAQALVPFDRGWVALYDSVAAGLEVLGCVGGHSKDLAPGQRMSLKDSVSGWAVRHRKPRVDQNLASTQGRFHDYKQLYRDRFQCVLVVPFFVRGRVTGTITLASKTAAQYDVAESASSILAPITTRLATFFEDPSLKLSGVFASPTSAPSSSSTAPMPESPASGPSEPVIRRQERQAALNAVSSFLATEIREPMGYIRAQLEEVTGDGVLNAEARTRIETAMRDLVRTESLINEILDFAKPLALERTPCHVVTLIEETLALVEMDLKVNRIEVTKDFPPQLERVRWDQEKVTHALLSIMKNALEAMSPAGHLRISVLHKRGRLPDMVIRIHNDGVPIPKDVSEKMFEPYFTTKRSGTGLGLAMVKKIVEEHGGRIGIDSSPEDGTMVTVTLPAMRPRSPHRSRGRSSPPGRRT